MTSLKRAEELAKKRCKKMYGKTSDEVHEKHGMQCEECQTYLAGYAACFRWVLERLRSKDAAALAAKEFPMHLTQEGWAKWLQAEREKEK